MLRTKWPYPYLAGIFLSAIEMVITKLLNVMLPVATVGVWIVRDKKFLIQEEEVKKTA